VIKPVFGAYGFGVRVLSRDEGRLFHDASGRSVRATELVEEMSADQASRGWILQERMRNHPDLVGLSRSSYLQCVRVLTLTGRSGECHVLHAHFKIIVGENGIDNFQFGATGNLTSRIRLADGVLLAALTPNPKGAGYVPATVHPDTGRRIEGVRLPFWPETCELARSAARRFLPLRLVGWDVAITPKGPVLIEANWNSDPTNPHRNMDAIREAIERHTGVVEP
jgi:hypothetical protein